MAKANLRSYETKLKKAQKDLEQKKAAYEQAKLKLFAEYGELKLKELTLKNPEQDFEIEELIKEQKLKNKQLKHGLSEEVAIEKY